MPFESTLQPKGAFVPGVAPLQPSASVPSGANSPDNTLQSTVFHHLAELGNPETSTKHGTSGPIKRLGGIWTYFARGFGDLPVFIRLGIVGAQLVIQLKPLNDQYEGSTRTLPFRQHTKINFVYPLRPWCGAGDPTIQIGYLAIAISIHGHRMGVGSTKLRKPGPRRAPNPVRLT